MDKSLPTFDQLLNPTLRALHELGGSASISELVAKVVEILDLPQPLVDVPHPGKANQTELDYRLAWARTYLKYFGLITNSQRGVWSQTARGTSTANVDPQEVVRVVREQVARRRQGKTVDPSFDEDTSETQAGEGETQSWRETLLAILLELAPDAFERLCQRLLRESGFIQVDVTGRSGDGGIDGQGILRLAGLLSFPVLFQCKRYGQNVGPGAVRDFRGAMIGRADKGLIITTAGFTRDAKAEATRDGAPPIDLIDGDQLIDKLKELKLGVQTRKVEIDEVDTDWFSSL